MLNFIYWPISFVLWCWHKVFSIPFGAESAISWILAIIFLTFTVRLLLLKPTIGQMRSSRKMQEMQPQMAAIREKYKLDKQKQAQEMQKLQREMGVNPLAGCLPVLIQLPVFLGLFHVLRSFNRTGTGHGQLGLSIEQNRETANYFFKAPDVQSFLDANLFGVPLSAYISMPERMYEAFTVDDLSKAKIATVAVPLILIIVLATHFNAKMAITRQQSRVASGRAQAPKNDMMASQMEMMNKMMVWIMPGTILITGVFWHIGLLFYMMANNIWTFFQQRWLFARMDAEEEAEIAAKKAAKRATAPKPGARPDNPKKKKKK
ncbi:membrane protein insertase YidC [Corynebacterium aquilae]|uniref:Membrane protein insertase YidC n=1 Tax=Corynebacterium aquilae DSM 44791 TaxID=1431546 RepID=A0A1L7CIQ9_9CORY|nr:membrane protein insertase YidC [Corynebacterium aquilae]APT85750.1 preprotein translocase subunit YidC [Corynebacterium aquilae DSM 44791]